MRGLIFADASVRAILAGRKTRTCRVKRPAVRAGERVYMAEAWRVAEPDGTLARGPIERPVVWPAPWRDLGTPLRLTYRADQTTPGAGPWRSPLMLREAFSRAQLRVESVDEAPMEALFANDAWLAAEGIVRDAEGFRYYTEPRVAPAPTARDAYLAMWRTLHKGEPMPDKAWHITFNIACGMARFCVSPRSKVR